MEVLNFAEENQSRESSSEETPPAAELVSLPVTTSGNSNDHPKTSIEDVQSPIRGEARVEDVQQLAQQDSSENATAPVTTVVNLTVPSSEMLTSSPPRSSSEALVLQSPDKPKTPVDSAVASSQEMLTSSQAQEPELLMEDPAIATPSKIDDGTSSSGILINGSNLASNVSVSSETMPAGEMKSKDDKVENLGKINDFQKKPSESDTKSVNPYKGLVDTAAPFESVREAVTKFGGIVDWKAHKVQTLERRRAVQLELENIRKDIPQYKEQSEAAEMAKAQVLEELEIAKRLVEELKHNLERAQTEEAQAKQDSELAQLRAKELEQGIADEASVVAKTQLEVAKQRHEKAVGELKSVKDELKSLQEQYATLVNERDIAINKAEAAIAAEKEVEKKVEELTLEVITTKEVLELAHAAHHEAEEHRLGAALVKEQDCLAWEKELTQAQEELQRLNEQLLSTKDLKSQLEAASALLQSINSELAAYMENKLSEEAEGTGDKHESDEVMEIRKSIKAALESKRKELEEVKANIEKAKNEVNCFKVAASSLRSKLDDEKAALVTWQQREGMASITVASLEAELDRTKEDIEVVRSKEKETREKMVELPKLLQQAAQEADEAKSAAQLAHEELRKAKEEAEQTKAGATTAEVRLLAVLKEIEASRASEKLALAAVKALQESEEARSIGEDSPRGVTIPIVEYYNLSKRVHEAEEHGQERVIAAMAQVESANEAESMSLGRLNAVLKEMDQKKEALEIALKRAERAKEGKLGAEQELRKWRAEHEQRRKANEAAKAAVNPLSFDHNSQQKSSYNEDSEKDVLANSKLPSTGTSPDAFFSDKKLRRKKKSFFPRLVMFLARKKAQVET